MPRTISLATMAAFFALWVSALLAPGPTRAEPVRTPHTTAELVADVAAVAPGEPFQAAIKITPMEGWHTYWRNPGDSGMATMVDWTLPDGFEAGDIQWPAPKALPYGPLTNYGYDGEHWLLVTITPPAGLDAESITLQARADWLVCEEICIPEGADLSLTVPVRAEAVRDPSQTAGFREARDALPEPYPGSAIYQAGDGVLAVKLEGAVLQDPVRFFPYSETLIRNEAAQAIGREGEATTIGVPMGSGDASGIVAGVVTAGEQAYEIEAEAGDVAPPAGTVGGGSSGVPGAGPVAGSGTGSSTGAALEALGLLQAMVLAFLGGILLNLMPCVFPVLSLKALAVVKASGLTLREKRVEGLLYAAGIIVSFLVLAGVLLAFRAGGAAVGWGFQLQSPEFVALLAVVLFAVGLSLSGYFELAGSFTGLGQGLVDRGGAAGAFATGVLATIVATPCTAPFMATALGAALMLSPTGALLVFFALGLGLAFPMLLISEIPAVGRLLPRPGPWMNRFRQFLAFPIYATVIWLAVVLGQQAGIHAVAMLLAVLLLVVFAIWAWTLGGGARATGKALGRGLALVALGISAWLVVATGGLEPAARQADGGPIAAEPFDPATLEAYRGEGAPVFVNFTAAWCITCLANERVALSTDAVADRFRDGDVRYLKGDWTRRDPVITETLAAYGRSGVPLYLYFAPGSDDAVVLPQLLTPEIVIEAMDEADRGRTSG